MLAKFEDFRVHQIFSSTESVTFVSVRMNQNSTEGIVHTVMFFGKHGLSNSSISIVCECYNFENVDGPSKERLPMFLFILSWYAKTTKIFF